MELRDYINVIRSRRGVILLATITVAAVALAVSLLQPPVYESQSKVLVSEKDTGAAIFGQVLPELSSQPERALQTQVELIEVRPIAEQTIKKLKLQESPDQLVERIDVAGVGQTNVIAIKARAGDPEEAAEVANTMAEEYVKASKARKRQSLAEAAEEVEARLEQARAEILAASQKVEQSGRTEELAGELSILTGTYATLAEKLEELRINEKLETGSGSVVQEAVPNSSPVAPKPVTSTALGLAVGLVFGLVMAFLYEYLDNTIKSSEEAEKIYGAPVVGIVPVEQYERGVKRQLTIVDRPGSAPAEAYRVLRNSLDFINFEHDLKTVLITSAAPAEGKSTVSANLAASLAQAGKKVVLVSCDFRRPTTDQFFDVTNAIGLSDVLLGTHSLKAALQQTSTGEQLLVLAAGKMPPNPSELLASSKMKEILDSLEEWADWVIVDTPPILAVADPVSVARWVDGVLMVSKAGESTREAALKAVELLGKVGARVIGVAVWGLDESKSGPGYGYGYYTGGYYYYRSYYGPAKTKKKGPSTDAGPDKGDWEARPSGARRVAQILVRVLVATLGVIAILAVAAVVLYFLDRYLGWGLVQSVSSFLQ